MGAHRGMEASSQSAPRSMENWSESQSLEIRFPQVSWMASPVKFFVVALTIRPQRVHVLSSMRLAGEFGEKWGVENLLPTHSNQRAVQVYEDQDGKSLGKQNPYPQGGARKII